MKRIQRKRTKGWKMPENAKYVGRPTQWGNPFILSPDGWILYRKSEKLVGSPWCYWSATGGFEIKDVIELYGQWLGGKLQKDHPYLPTPPSKPMLPTVLICDCNSREHQIIIEHDSEDNLIYCHIHLVKHGFWRRLKAGLKYIFGYKCRYGQWEEFILKPEHATRLRELSELLSGCSK